MNAWKFSLHCSVSIVQNNIFLLLAWRKQNKHHVLNSMQSDSIKFFFICKEFLWFYCSFSFVLIQNSTLPLFGKNVRKVKKVRNKVNKKNIRTFFPFFFLLLPSWDCFLQSSRQKFFRHVRRIKKSPLFLRSNWLIYVNIT